MGSIFTDRLFRPSSSASTITKAAVMEMYEVRLRPFSPASRNREGSMPAISPTNTQTDGSGYLFSRKPSSLATPRKPTATPSSTGMSLGICVLKFLNGLLSSSMTGWYMPKMTQSTPPDMPGSMAPRPISMPCMKRLACFLSVPDIFLEAPDEGFSLCIGFLPFCAVGHGYMTKPPGKSSHTV